MISFSPLPGWLPDILPVSGLPRGNGFTGKHGHLKKSRVLLSKAVLFNVGMERGRRKSCLLPVGFIRAWQERVVFENLRGRRAIELPELFDQVGLVIVPVIGLRQSAGGVDLRTQKTLKADDSGQLPG